MRATNWEFTNRALVFGLIFGFVFPLYFFDHYNSTAALANWLESRLQMDADLVARLLFAFAAVLLVVAALIRTWASAPGASTNLTNGRMLRHKHYGALCLNGFKTARSKCEKSRSFRVATVRP
jgi:hypothetical protein